MKTTMFRRKAQVKSSFKLLESVCIALVSTFWAIMTSAVAGFATLSIHEKGAPRKS